MYLVLTFTLPQHYLDSILNLVPKYHCPCIVLPSERFAHLSPPHSSLLPSWQPDGLDSLDICPVRPPRGQKVTWWQLFIKQNIYQLIV